MAKRATAAKIGEQVNDMLENRIDNASTQQTGTAKEGFYVLKPLLYLGIGAAARIRNHKL